MPIRQDGPVPPIPASSPAQPAAPTGIALWIVGARPRTLPVSVAPVLVGVACAANAVAAPWFSHISWWRFLLALIVSLALQIGVNYANDYSDGIRGSDKDRVGPLRLTGSGAVPARRVKFAAFAAFAIAGLCGLALAASTSWWLLVVGSAAIAAAWFYTGGSSPYGYRGLGDISVFVFFGLVAVMGTAFVSADRPRLTVLALACSIPVGLLAVAVLVANNLRDLPKDALVDKRTSAVRLGDHRTRILYSAIMVAPTIMGVAIVLTAAGRSVFAVVGGIVLILAAGLLVIFPVRKVLALAAGRELIPVLARTGRVQLVYAVALSAALLLHVGALA